MIASVNGVVRSVGADAAVVEVGGVGLLIQGTPQTLLRCVIGEPVALSTSLVVREDSLTLYGFATDEERALFEVLQTASGVGPKVAQAVLSTLSVQEVRQAITTSDLAVLTRVPGIGKKGAERLVLDLRDKIGLLGPSTMATEHQPSVAPAAPWREQLQAALMSLGWSSRESDEAITVVEPQAHQMADEGDIQVSVLLRAALRSLSR